MIQFFSMYSFRTVLDSQSVLDHNISIHTTIDNRPINNNKRYSHLSTHLGILPTLVSRYVETKVFKYEITFT